jgi:hypothetical protein
MSATAPGARTGAKREAQPRWVHWLLDLVLKQDLKPEGFPPDLDWSPEQREASLAALHRHALQHCRDCISWYYRSKGAKSFWAFWLRFLSILLIALAGLIPLLADLIPRQFGEGRVLTIAPGWSAVILASVALLSGIDRFLGLSSGWVRYVRTAQALTERLTQFQFEWEELRCQRQWSPAAQDLLPNRARAGLASPSVVADPSMEALALCYDFVKGVHTLVRKETDLWAQEFERAVRLLDRNNNDQTFNQLDPAGKKAWLQPRIYKPTSLMASRCR